MATLYHCKGPNIEGVPFKKEHHYLSHICLHETPVYLYRGPSIKDTRPTPRGGVYKIVTTGHGGGSGLNELRMSEKKYQIVTYLYSLANS